LSNYTGLGCKIYEKSNANVERKFKISTLEILLKSKTNNTEEAIIKIIPI
jgi:hypothetical protein